MKVMFVRNPFHYSVEDFTVEPKFVEKVSIDLAFVYKLGRNFVWYLNFHDFVRENPKQLRIRGRRYPNRYHVLVFCKHRSDVFFGQLNGNLLLRFFILKWFCFNAG